MTKEHVDASDKISRSRQRSDQRCGLHIHQHTEWSLLTFAGEGGQPEWDSVTAAAASAARESGWSDADRRSLTFVPMGCRSPPPNDVRR
jgi:hypothetical protein